MQTIDQITEYYTKEYGGFYGKALSILRDKRDAEDAVQQAFLYASKYSEKYQENNLRAWLYKIVMNASLNIYRKRARTPHHVEFLDTYSGSVEFDYASDIPDEILDELDKLDAKQKSILFARADGLKYKEIAKRTGVCKGTVMSSLSRTRKKLKRKLNGLNLEPKALNSKDLFLE